MKRILYSACVVMAIAFTSCGDAADDSSANKAEGDTAVLVEDPNNTLEANPVNDTTVHDTATSH